MQRPPEQTQGHPSALPQDASFLSLAPTSWQTHKHHQQLCSEEHERLPPPPPPPCEAFLSVGSMFSSFVISRLSREGQCRKGQKASTDVHLSLLSWPPSFLICPSLSVAVAATSSHRNKEARQALTNSNCFTVAEIIIKCLSSTALPTLRLLI